MSLGTPVQRTAWVGLWWWALGSGAHAEPISLPPSEDPDVWEEPLMLAGLDVGEPGAGAGALLTPGTDQWTLMVRDRAGVLHEVRVAAPTSAAQREEIAFLAASLLEPVVQPVLAPVVAPPPLPPRPRPKPVPKPKPVPPPPPVPVPVAPAPPVAPEPEPTPRVRLAAGPVIRFSPVHAPALGLSLATEIEVGSHLHAGPVARLGTSSTLRGQREPRVVSAGDLGLRAGWSHGAPIDPTSSPALRALLPTVDAELALSRRRYLEADVQVAVYTVPVAGLVMAWPVEVPAGFGVRPTLQLSTDLRAVRIREQGDEGDIAARTSALIGIDGTWGWRQ